MMNKQVYIVYRSDEDYRDFGVYSTEEKAHAAIVKLAEFEIADRRKWFPDEKWRIEEDKGDSIHLICASKTCRDGDLVWRTDPHHLYFYYSPVRLDP